jgi:hypothetical protein
MKTSLLRALPLAFWSAVSWSGELRAQASSPPAAALTTVVSPATEASAPPTYELALRWNEKLSGVLSVPIRNDSKQPLLILGVQATSGLFVGDYPSRIEAGKEDTIAFIYNAAENTEGELDLIRLLTDQGIKEIRVRLAREQAVSADAREVHWSVGDKAEAKTVTLTVAAGSVVPVKVRTSVENQASLEAVDATTYRIRITPGSTAHSRQFAVFVDFDRPLPGKAVVILGVVQPRE